MITSSRIRLLALAAALTFAAAGCGGDSNSSGTDASNPPPPSVTGDSSDVLAQAAEATTAAGTYKTTFEMAMEGGPNGSITLSGEGEFQADPPLGKVTTDFSAITGGALGGEAVVIMDGSTMYMQVPALSSGAKPWIKIDTESLGGIAGMSQLSQITQGDPTQTLQYLSGATKDVEEAGTEEIRGVETTKYTMTIDLSEATELETTGVTEVPAEVWIDGDGLVRKTVTHFDGITAAGGPTSMTVTQEIYDFGEEVDIEVPGDDEVMDFGDLGGLIPTVTSQQ